MVLPGPGTPQSPGAMWPACCSLGGPPRGGRCCPERSVPWLSSGGELQEEKRVWCSDTLFPTPYQLHTDASDDMHDFRRPKLTVGLATAVHSIVSTEDLCTQWAVKKLTLGCRRDSEQVRAAAAATAGPCLGSKAVPAPAGGGRQTQSCLCLCKSCDGMQCSTRWTPLLAPLAYQFCHIDDAYTNSRAGCVGRYPRTAHTCASAGSTSASMMWRMSFAPSARIISIA